MTNYRHHSPAREPCPEPAAVKPLLPAFFFEKRREFSKFYAGPPAPSRRNAHFAQKWPFGLDRTPPVFKNTVFYGVCAHLFSQNRKVIPLSHKTLGFSSAEKHAIYSGSVRHALHSRAIWPFSTHDENHSLFTVCALTFVRNPRK